MGRGVPGGLDRTGGVHVRPFVDAEAVIKHADAALYRAKADGRDRVMAAPATPELLAA